VQDLPDSSCAGCHTETYRQTVILVSNTH